MYPTGTTLFQRTIIRIVSFSIIVGIVYVTFFKVYPFFGDNANQILAILATYLVAAYIMFPIAVRFYSWSSGKRKIPRYTQTAEGLPHDPINMIIVGSLENMVDAFASKKWYVADKLNIKSGSKLVRDFVLNRHYPQAPFSSLYLFGRKQDMGFQKPIGKSPRKRHHVRFWAYVDTHNSLVRGDIWHIAQTPNLDKAFIWLGAATKDTGLGYRGFTFQIAHSVSKDSNQERDYIVKNLLNSGHVKKVEYYEGKDEIKIGKVNKFKTDDQLAVIYLI